MKAVVFDSYGAPDVLHIREVPTPEVKPNQVLVRVEASSVTVADLRMRRASPFLIRLLYGIFAPRKTNILGFEIAGRVVARGSDAREFQLNDRVFAYCTSKFGGYGEYIALDASGAIVPIPESLDYAEAAVTPVAGVTVVRFLKKTNIKAGDRVLVHGASGSVGSFAVQCAKFLGAHVTAVCSGDKAEFVKGLGADEVIDYRNTLPSNLGQQFDVIINNVSSFWKSRFRHNLKPGTRYVSVFEQIKPTKADMEELSRLFDGDAYKPMVDRVFQVSEIQDAHAFVETKAKKGNVAIEMTW